MARKSGSVSSVVVGELLPGLGRRLPAYARDDFSQYAKLMAARAVFKNLGGSSQRTVRALSRNAMRVPQSVVKRVRNGGTHNKTELKRQLNYVVRDEAMRASWSNFNGVERELKESTIDKTANLWTSGWAGNPQRGHTDHIILSFPKDTDQDVAEAISRAWGREIFNSGNYGDTWRYIAAMHANTEHVHCHFVVDKHGIEHGRFLSISMKSELNYEIMREMHAKIAAEHGLSLNASSRLSRGIADYPPRETEVRAAHDHGGEITTPQMSEVERLKRHAIIEGFAQKYRDLAGMATFVSRSDPGGFMERLAALHSSAGEALDQGERVLADIDVNTPPSDPSEALLAAQQRFLETSRHAWESIQGMDPGAERTMLEAEFIANTREARQVAFEDDFFKSHADFISPDLDPYQTTSVSELLSARDFVAGEDGDLRAVDRSLSDIREQLITKFSEHEEDLLGHGTNAEEMAERFMLAGRTEGQLEAWAHLGYDREFETSKLIADDLMQLGSEYRSMGYDEERIDIELDRHREDALKFADANIRPQYQRSYMELVEQLSQEADNIIDDYELPRDVNEMIARDQLMEADRYSRLADVPAIERIVDELNDTLSEEDLQRVRAGDATALLEEVKDPAIRAAVASELRNEADLTPVEDVSESDGTTLTRHSEPVEQFQQMVRLSRSNTLDSKDAAPDLGDDFGL